LIVFLLASVFVVALHDSVLAEDAKPKEEVAMITMKQQPEGISPTSV
jgi:hypothetical protein